mmetsp:Transcript_29474/g.63859  ORF Transcript_29474/g.63859 Transcript_29474/m.63859 type:complete len:364 (-) Transcript_29474:44-1135(-)|eukprot:CAMPEP_0206426426 /NCGR_PEP_ID=MMETSP0324_2-20121206/4367_1 /ASSEMBLY_ACC=CAM_ASM_000836 /TAXON_ID=2866 /ORGANISM="Crypthecodinium cohnii, Strain Seligo" /LENGTH=363 /DNA_ID=CAMNT_0053891371 /DNA_START=64 /DNA_END=1155 /DNA_ORIENTATION=+
MGKSHKILCLPGDGVGPELLVATKLVLEATGVPLEYEDLDYGQTRATSKGSSIAEEHFEAFERCRCILKGPITVPTSGPGSVAEVRGKKYTSANQALRKAFSLYANVRPALHMDGAGGRFPGTDIVVVRENTEGAYSGEEYWENPDSVVCRKRITRAASLRIARFAFDYAVKNGRKLVTAVHKVNVHRQTDGLFLECCRQVAKEYPKIKYSEQLADSLLTAMVLDPGAWDVLLCENLYGDLVSDLAAGLIGGLGLAPAGQFGEGMALFEPCHGSAPDIAGKNVVNPCSLLLSAAMMLDHLGEHQAGSWLRHAVSEVISEAQTVTKDLGGSASTTEMATAIAAKVKALRAPSNATLSTPPVAKL